MSIKAGSNSPSHPAVTCAAIIARFPLFFGETQGDLNRMVTGVNSPESATATEMCFLATPKALEAGLAGRAQVLVVSPKYKDQTLAAAGERTIVFAPHPEKSMALVISAFFRATPYTGSSTTSIHPSAFVGAGAKIAPSARVGAHAYIGANVTLGERVYIGPNAVIEDNAIIGESSVIHPLAFIGHSTQIGSRCEVHPSAVIGKEGFGYAHDEKFNHTRIPHQGIVVLEDDVHIGSCTTIDRGTFGETRIERGVIIDNIVHIAHNNHVGRNSVLTSGFTMAGSSKVGANFVTGGKTVVTGHIEVCDNVQASALSGISKSITKPGVYGGHPLQSLQPYLKTQAAISHLPYIYKMIKKIVKQLGLEEETTSRFTD